MGGGSPELTSAPTGAVFLSYASQDAEVARRICDALRASGIEVWFDQSELRGGDAWDRQIRQQIHDCRLFIALISAHTEARDEGYFRREWKLAVDRTHDMAEKKTFLVPVVIDDTSERGASVPDKFHEVQWARLPGGNTPLLFVEHVWRVLSLEPSATSRPTATALPGFVPTTTARAPSWSKPAWLAMVVFAVGGACLVAERVWHSNHAREPLRVRPTASELATRANATPDNAVSFIPPPHSIAVLPFANLSGNPKQEYFSDGVSEELINALSHIESLQVVARTSSFSFKGQNVDVGTIARKLNVGTILEGSVRRAGNKVRITAQLINTVNGFHLWSEDYDRDLKDILALQTDIATAVARQLQVKLLGVEASSLELGETDNPLAYDAYLRAAHLMATADTLPDFQAGLAALNQVVTLDPGYAAALALRARALIDIAGFTEDRLTRKRLVDSAQRDAERAVALAPSLASAHIALGWFVRAVSHVDFSGAEQEMRRAIALEPGSAYVQCYYGAFQTYLGHFEEALTAARYATRLDPLNFRYRVSLSDDLYRARHFKEAVSAADDALSLTPDAHEPNAYRVLSYLGLGQFEQARKMCESRSVQLDDADRHYCLAIAYHALGNAMDAERELQELKSGDRDNSRAYVLATIYAQWRDRVSALHWLATADRAHNPDLAFLKVDWMLDPIRNEPEFREIERRLRIPS
jgi:TolB-like protein/Flp pilus assembly protein TadD